MNKNYHRNYLNNLQQLNNRCYNGETMLPNATIQNTFFVYSFELLGGKRNRNRNRMKVL